MHVGWLAEHQAGASSFGGPLRHKEVRTPWLRMHPYRSMTANPTRARSPMNWWAAAPTERPVLCLVLRTLGRARTRWKRKPQRSGRTLRQPRAGLAGPPERERRLFQVSDLTAIPGQLSPLPVFLNLILPYFKKESLWVWINNSLFTDAHTTSFTDRPTGNPSPIQPLFSFLWPHFLCRIKSATSWTWFSILFLCSHSGSPSPYLQIYYNLHSKDSSHSQLWQ